MAGVRCFVGLPLPKDAQAGLERVVLRLSGQLASRISWTRPGNWHLTLKFLGDVAEERLPGLIQALGGVAFAPLPLAVGRAGFFPSAGRGGPKGLWAELRLGGPECARLAAAVERALEPLGFAPEKRPFAPHLTLGRVKDAAPGDDWTLVDRALAAESWPVGEVDRFVLWRSALGPGGPQYFRLAEFGVGRGASGIL
ncbi:MAG: RNA 2',3'-cyclic phosphodiesterase [Humidesulfovibrio sp.]|uniref:RNA 2',3'-cyclic phosphodiesterase n=1 Tax=Humidesulfovibrio sp. TaxID=2910988 RepID=UPI0027EE078D|nr:RNA 2',3'-cyclic phosphodiesterase [Humidesulfovibrio sp.]MDQ7834938.1 RNA 2',3'-cyclic phosphodiesterase [Humidesulfovibrio sp.]